MLPFTSACARSGGNEATPDRTTAPIPAVHETNSPRLVEEPLRTVLGVGVVAGMLFVLSVIMQATALLVRSFEATRGTCVLNGVAMNAAAWTEKRIFNVSAIIFATAIFYSWSSPHDAADP